MYCPKCGKENQGGARFCMHCGADLSGYKVEISPNINVSPRIEVKTSNEKKEIMCEICGERDAVAYCKKCGRKVCYGCFEPEFFGGHLDGWYNSKLKETCILCGATFIRERISNATNNGLPECSSAIKHRAELTEEIKSNPKVSDRTYRHSLESLYELERDKKEWEEFIKENTKNLNKIRERLAKISKKKSW